MDIDERRAGSVVVLAPAGRIDMLTSDEFRDHLLPLVNAAAGTGEAVVLDFSGVDYISSAGLRVLMLAAKQARAASSRVVVAALQPLVQEIFQISRFDKILPCHRGVDEALAALAAEA
jgi:anti-anti-sigma factor